jgi:hypothetical protein
MVTLKNDELAFSFPELGLSLRPFIEQYSQATLPCLVAEDRRLAIEKLHADWCFREASRERQTQAEKRVLSAGAEEIEDVFHRVSTAAVKGYVDCGLQICFHRTLRIPDDGRTYPLPAGLGLFPLHDIDEFQQSVPPLWLERGGVLMPMYQSEALWIYFDTSYPFAVKVGAGKINAVTGESFGEDLAVSPQDPNATHQIERRLRPKSPCTLEKGDPLSLRIASGKPWRAKSCSKLWRTVWLRAFSSARTFRT